MLESQEHQNRHQAFMATLEKAVSQVLSDPTFLRHLAEEIADRLDGFEDERLLEILQAEENGEKVDMARVRDALKS